MKFIVFCLTVTSTLALNAATIVWGAGGFSNKGVTVTNGTAYLVQYTGSETITTDKILDTIATNGLSDDYSSYKYWTPFNLGSETSVPSTSFYDVTTSTSGFFTVVIDAAKENVVVSSIKDATVISGVGENPDQYNVAFSFRDTWSTGSVAAVPEPTVLALLALGVAGVALRRKKVVA